MTPNDGSFVPLESLGGATPGAEAPSRRRFLELMAAATAMGGAACTRKPTEFIVPYVDPPENVIPGRPSYYATARLVNGTTALFACGFWPLCGGPLRIRQQKVPDSMCSLLVLRRHLP